MAFEFYQKVSHFVSTILLTAYVAIGIWFLIFLIRNIKVSTSTTGNLLYGTSGKPTVK